MKNEFRDEFDKLLLLDNDKEKIKNNIYRISNINKRKRKMYSLFLSLIFVSFMTFCIAYADDIKDTLNNIFYYHVTKGDYQKKDYIYINSNAVKEINQNANLVSPSKCVAESYSLALLDNLDKDCYPSYTVYELEKELGVKLLKSNYFKNQRAIYDIEVKNNDKYAYLSFGYYINSYFDRKNYLESEPSIYFSYVIKTKYYDRVNEILGIGKSAESKNIEQYYIKKIKTTASIIKKNDNDIYYVFDYDGIIYYGEIVDPNDSVRLAKNIFDSLKY